MNIATKSFFISDFFKYIIGAVCCAILGIIYHRFSHGVYSTFMGYMFVVPLVLGALPSIIMYFCGIRFNLVLSRALLCAGVVTLTLGMFLTGVFEIYGTRAELLAIHWVMGTFLILGAVLAGIFEKLRFR